MRSGVEAMASSGPAQPSPVPSAQHQSASSSSSPQAASVERWLLQHVGGLQESIASTPHFHEGVTLKPLKVEMAEPGRFVCSFRVPAHLTNSLQVLHPGVIASLVDNVGAAALVAIDGRVRVSVDLNISYASHAHTDDEIVVDATILNYTTRIGVVLVTLTNKTAGLLVAQGRHTLYYPASKAVTASKL